MRIEVVKAGCEDEPVLEHLLQLYQYDFSEIMAESRVGDDGLYHYMSLGDTWTDASWHAFLVRVEGEFAGFALVHQKSHFTGDANVTDMDEFFVMRKYRRKGVGKEVATRLFDMFPGCWEVREVQPNVGAQAFWREVIREYTAGQFEERLVESEQWHGPVQSFESGHRTERRRDGD